MENHPIPQDVTGFQFKLIGDMTVKQFAYLALGVIFAWVFYLFPVPFLIKLPFLLFSAGFGAALAFIPYEGRPLDVMIKNFFKSLTTPTQFIFIRVGGHFYFPQAAHVAQNKPAQTTTSLSGQHLQDYLKSLPQKSHNSLDNHEMQFFQSLSGLQQAGVAQPQPMVNPGFQAATPQPPKPVIKQEPKKTEPVQAQQQQATAPTQQEEALVKETAQLKDELAKARQEEQQQKTSPQAAAAHQKVLELEQELQNVSSQKALLENQIQELQKKLTQQQQVFTPTQAVPQQATKNVRTVSFAMAKSAGMPLAIEAPNVINGIIKDPRNNPLPNILVEIKDKEGNPVRAFKTNGLGQFASATPLLSNTYTIEFEDPKGIQKFDTIQIEAKGEPIPPLEVISIDAREELRQSLFGPSKPAK